MMQHLLRGIKRCGWTPCNKSIFYVNTNETVMKVANSCDTLLCPTHYYMLYICTCMLYAYVCVCMITYIIRYYHYHLEFLCLKNENENSMGWYRNLNVAITKSGNFIGSLCQHGWVPLCTAKIAFGQWLFRSKYPSAQKVNFLTLGQHEGSGGQYDVR